MKAEPSEMLNGTHRKGYWGFLSFWVSSVATQRQGCKLTCLDFAELGPRLSADIIRRNRCSRYSVSDPDSFRSPLSLPSKSCMTSLDPAWPRWRRSFPPTSQGFTIRGKQQGCCNNRKEGGNWIKECDRAYSTYILPKGKNNFMQDTTKLTPFKFCRISALGIDMHL